MLAVGARGAPYDVKVYLGTLSQALVVGAVLTSPLAVSLYEFRSKRKVEARIFALRGSSTFKALLITLAGLTDSNLLTGCDDRVAARVSATRAGDNGRLGRLLRGPTDA